MDTEADVEKLRNILEGHMLRRMKADVDLEIPDKQELIVRVELSKSQKDLYRAVLTRNYEVLNEKTTKFRCLTAPPPHRPTAPPPHRPAGAQ